MVHSVHHFSLQYWVATHQAPPQLALLCYACHVMCSVTIGCCITTQVMGSPLNLLANNLAIVQSSQSEYLAAGELLSNMA